MNYPNRVIKKGESNKTIVRALQQKLNEVGCGPIDVDGDFGPQTFKSVKQFQATRRDQNGNPLEIDGKVGSITWSVLFGNVTVPVEIETPNEFLKEALKFAVTQIGVMEKPLGEAAGLGWPPDLWITALGWLLVLTTVASMADRGLAVLRRVSR